ncbi:MAG: hypothetical protein ACE5KU_03130 [Nitrososphaerales archaeon]
MAKQKITYEDLLRIIDLCRVVETRGSDPFEVDVQKSLTTLKKHLPRWKLLDELLLDAEALSQITSIIRLQKKWIAYRASSLYVDPLVVELKIRLSTPEALAKALAKSWHPAVSLEQISPKRLSDAMDYWNNLLPLDERFAPLSQGELLEPGSFDFEDLVRLKVVLEEEFRDLLSSLLLELKERIGSEGRVEYEDFVYVEDFQETVLRAYLTSFLVSEGAVILQVDPLEEEAYLALGSLEEPSSRTPSNSKVITIDHESWRMYKERGKVE